MLGVLRERPGDRVVADVKTLQLAVVGDLLIGTVCLCSDAGGAASGSSPSFDADLCVLEDDAVARGDAEEVRGTEVTVWGGLAMIDGFGSDEDLRAW